MKDVDSYTLMRYGFSILECIMLYVEPNFLHKRQQDEIENLNIYFQYIYIYYICISI